MARTVWQGVYLPADDVAAQDAVMAALRALRELYPALDFDGEWEKAQPEADEED